MATSKDYEWLYNDIASNMPAYSASADTAAYKNQLSAAENAVSNIKDFQQSQTATDYQNALNNLQKPGEYQSQYQSTIDSLMSQILNREKFSYDFNADPIYQQYKDQYTKLGNEAGMNAAANASALTGGYGSSYATTAAAQANQQYLTQLNNIIPQLAETAYQKYADETSSLYNQFNMVGTAEDRAYGQYRDSVTDYNTERDYLSNMYADQRNFDYSQYSDAVSRLLSNRDYYNNAYSNSVSRDNDAYSNAMNAWSAQLGIAGDMYSNAYTAEQNALKKSGSSSSSGKQTINDQQAYMISAQATKATQDAIKQMNSIGIDVSDEDATAYAAQQIYETLANGGYTQADYDYMMRNLAAYGWDYLL